MRKDYQNGRINCAVLIVFNINSQASPGTKLNQKAELLRTIIRAVIFLSKNIDKKNRLCYNMQVCAIGVYTHRYGI